MVALLNPEPVRVSVAVAAGGRLRRAPPRVNWIGVPVAVSVKLLAAGTDAEYTRMYHVPGAADGTSNCGLA